MKSEEKERDRIDKERERRERRVIHVENGLIVLAILALWPAILRVPDHITWPVLLLALATMLVIMARRWRRLLSLKRRLKAGEKPPQE